MGFVGGVGAGHALLQLAAACSVEVRFVLFIPPDVLATPRS